MHVMCLAHVETWWVTNSNQSHPVMAIITGTHQGLYTISCCWHDTLSHNIEVCGQEVTKPCGPGGHGGSKGLQGRLRFPGGLRCQPVATALVWTGLPWVAKGRNGDSGLIWRQ